MTLINCPECGKEISDMVKACPHCGYPLSEELSQEKVVQPQQVEVTGVKIKKSGFLKTIVIVASILVIALLAYFGINYFNEKKTQLEYEKAFNTYVDNLNAVRMLTIMGGADAESLCNLTVSVWRNAIYEERDSETDKYTRPKGFWVNDFNEALANLYSDNTTKSTIRSIESNQEEVQDLMKSLQDPPEGLEKCYDTVTELYTEYKGFTDLAIDPSGSYTSFTETIRSRSQDFMDAYEKLENQIPEKFQLDKEDTTE